MPLRHPPWGLYYCIQAGLKLSEQQQQQVLELRARVIMWLNKAAELRSESYSAIGHDLAWQPDVRSLSWLGCLLAHLSDPD